jgi:hypothetical protein
MFCDFCVVMSAPVELIALGAGCDAANVRDQSAYPEREEFRGLGVFCDFCVLWS